VQSLFLTKVDIYNIYLQYIYNKYVIQSSKFSQAKFQNFLMFVCFFISKELVYLKRTCTFT